MSRAKRAGRPVRPAPVRDIATLEVAMDRIREGFASGTGIRDIASQSGLPLFHFRRQFTAYFGKTPKVIASELQVQAAKAMLLAGRSPREIAEACGFAARSHFLGRFRQLTGQTPARWLAAQKSHATASPLSQ